MSRFFYPMRVSDLSMEDVVIMHGNVGSLFSQIVYVPSNISLLAY